MAVDPLEILLRVANAGQPIAGPAGPIVHHRLRRGPMDPLLRPDGPPIHPVIGGGEPQHPLLRIYKHRARRTVA